jgi:cytochrome c553
MRRVIFAWALVAFVLIGIPAFAECRHLFRAQVVHHGHHVQPIVHQNIFYSVGEGLIQQVKIEQEVQRQVKLALQQQAQPQQQTTATSGVFAVKCSRCHKGDNALTSDPGTFKAFARMAGLGEGIPNEMKAVIGGLTAAEKGELTEYLLRLPAARTEPQVTVPPPEESGVLR